MKKQLLYYALKYQGDYKRIQYALTHHEKWQEVGYSGHYLSIFDAQYPKQLLQLRCPP